MSEETTVTLPDNWVAYITPFAAALGLEVAAASDLLKSVAGEPGEQAIEILKDDSLSPNEEIREMLPEGTPTGVANKAIATLRESMVTNAEPAMLVNPAADLLPDVPNDESWLSAMRSGGELKFDETSVISAVRAALADRVGLFDLPKKLTVAMEAQADVAEEQLDPRFWKLHQQLTRRDYAAIFAAIDGLDGKFVTEKRKRNLLTRINERLWPSVVGFQSQLKGWVEAWQQGAANPSLMMSAMAQMMSGGGMGALPPGMMQPPDTGGLRDAAETVNDDLNRIFAGMGVVVSRAMAYDANQIKATMEDSALPALVGAVNRDQMLRQLGVAVSSNYARMETNLTKFVMGILGVKDVAAGNEETAYFGSLYMLGTQIPWDQIGIKSHSPVRRHGELHDPTITQYPEH